MSQEKRNWGDETWSRILQYDTRIKRLEALQPWNLESFSYCSFHILFLLFIHHNRTHKHRGRLWRLHQTMAHRAPQPISGQLDLIINIRKYHISFPLLLPNYDIRTIISMNGWVAMTKILKFQTPQTNSWTLLKLINMKATILKSFRIVVMTVVLSTLAGQCSCRALLLSIC